MKETLEIFQLAIKLKLAFDNAKEDGKITWTDSMYLVNVIPSLLDAIDGIDQVPNEWADLSDDEKVELQDKFGELVDDAKVQQIFRGLLEIAQAFL